VRFDDDFTDKDRIFALSDGAFRLWVSVVAYCNRKLTDGYVDKVRLPTLVPRYRPALATELVKSGLLVDRGEQLEVDDYLSFQPSAEKVREKQATLSERGKKGARKRWGDGDKHGYGHSSEHDHGYSDRDSPSPVSPVVGKDSPSVKSEVLREDSTDDGFMVEAKQRLAEELAAGKRIRNHPAYLAKTVENLHLEGFTPPPEPWQPCRLNGCDDKGRIVSDNHSTLCPCHPRFKEYA
jgi:hypothetical protein